MTLNNRKFLELPQRQKNFAKTKLALLNALLDEFETKNLSSIKIRDLCLKAEVSEPTFYNYFNSKQHIVLYFIQIWSIEMNVLADSFKKAGTSTIDTIKNIFLKSAKDISSCPRIMLEILSFLAHDTELPVHEISDAEKWLHFKEVDAVETLEGKGMDSFLPTLIGEAVLNGELDKDTDQGILFIMLSSLFLGTSLLLLKKDPEMYVPAFEAELDFIFKKAGYEK
ncbi:MAG: TetR/AcrR family transcriptional regulator [Deltaproteobacteria bacterium]|nr:TetR/AcrR family transcriptional regulator [Deltaproteobacteria bacterium]